MLVILITNLPPSLIEEKPLHKAAHRIAAVKITLDHLLDYRTEIPVLLFKTIFIFSKEPLEIISDEISLSIICLAEDKIC